MADPNRLQIIAEFVDKVSQPVRRLERTFRDFDKTNRSSRKVFRISSAAFSTPKKV